MSGGSLVRSSRDATLSVRSRPAALLAVLLWSWGLLSALSASAQTSGPVLVAEVRGVVNPALATYVSHTIDEAEREGAALVVLELDTPGGLDTSMRQITQRILASRVPVAVYVYPPGARAASAGVFVTYAAHIAAMAPTTNIGSAHPVSIGGDGSEQQTSSDMMEKVTNDAVASIRSMAELRGRNADWAEEAVRSSKNLQASEALSQNVVDVVAEDLPSLGGLALVYELGNPGAILPGVVGGIAVLLALYSLGTLPINMAGIGLILFALLLLLVDLLMAGSGVLTVGGILSFVLGSLLLAISPESQAYLRVSLPAVVTMSLLMAGVFTFLVAAIVQVRMRPSVVGAGTLPGARGVARSDVGAGGTVMVQGGVWQARAADPSNPIPSGSQIRVVSVDGLRLTVQPD